MGKSCCHFRIHDTEEKKGHQPDGHFCLDSGKADFKKFRERIAQIYVIKDQ